jgi:hypothetical protein
MRPSARQPPAAYAGDQLGLKVCLRPEPEEADLSGTQHGSATGKRREPVDGAVDVEHVRHPHPVQGAVDRAARHVEVSMPIDVDDAQPLDTMLKTGHGADPDRAVASEDQDRVLGWSGTDQRGDLAGTVDDGIGVRCPGDVRVRSPPKGGHLPAAAHRHTDRLQPLDQTSLE